MRIRDWSSDVCSSDLHGAGLAQRLPRLTQHHPPKTAVRKTPQGDSVKKLSTLLIAGAAIAVAAPVHAKKTNLTVSSRSEERRVGNEYSSTCRSRWSPNKYKKNQMQITKK